MLAPRTIVLAFALAGFAACDDTPVLEPPDMTVVVLPDLTVLPDLLEPRDLLPPPPDLADPCGSMMEPPGPGKLVARCSIGNPPLLDGDLRDWAFLSTFMGRSEPSYGFGWGGMWPANPIAQDRTLAADMWARWDRENLYFAARLRDEQVRFGLPPGAADAVQLFIDSDGMGGGEWAPDDRRVIIPVDVENGNAPAQLCGAAACQTSWTITAKVQVTPMGWQIEVQLPWASVGGAPLPGRRMGFTLQLSDNDVGAAERDRYVVWYANPDVTPVGEKVPADASLRPSMFGSLVLGTR